MSKVFEDYFGELQADMVAICFEYACKKVDNIYIYCSREESVYSVGFFYKINGKLLDRHEINKENSQCDVSTEMQKQVMDILINDLKEIHKLFIESKKEMPTEIKLVFDSKTNDLHADYIYENIITNDSELLDCDIEEKWFNEIKNCMEK